MDSIVIILKSYDWKNRNQNQRDLCSQAHMDPWVFCKNLGARLDREAALNLTLKIGKIYVENLIIHSID